MEPISEQNRSCPQLSTNCYMDTMKRERNGALALAHQYRDFAQATRTCTVFRQQRKELEDRVEVVRTFWCNHAVKL